MITSSAIGSNVLKIKLMPAMYSCIEVNGVTVVLAAILPEETCKLVKQPQLTISHSAILTILSNLVKEDKRLRFFSSNCSDIVCDKLNLTNGLLECTNSRTVTLSKSLAPIYHPCGGVCEVFDLFCFFELNSSQIEHKFRNGSAFLLNKNFTK